MLPTKTSKGNPLKKTFLSWIRQVIPKRSDSIVTPDKRKDDKLNLDEEKKNLTKVECNANNKKSVNILKAKDDNGNGPLSPPSAVPEGVVDFDRENWNDPLQASHYPMNIFIYLKNRESQFIMDDYMQKQVHIGRRLRSFLVDWMVQVQEGFELYHETLYLAVKLVDMYLCKTVILKHKLQLLGAAALFIACKFEETTPPDIKDFLRICDKAYNHNELIKMEKNVLITINFDLGIPLSYGFLRRFARCIKVPLPILTLARYILEYSLMEYKTIKYRDSQLACASLFMALRMNGKQNSWSKTLEYYTGYKLEEFFYIVPILNNGLQKDTMKTIRKKYSHKIFFEVAKIPLMSTAQIFE